MAESSTIGPSRPTAPAEATVACEEAQFTTVRAQVEHANPQDDRFQDGPTA